MVQQMITNILMAISQSIVYCILFAVMAMFLYLFAKDKGLKAAIKLWIHGFKENRQFRLFFLLAFYFAFVLFVTLFNRFQWTNPLQNVMGVWGVYNAKGELTTEFIENIALFIPVGILAPACFQKLDRKIWLVLLIGLIFSSCIEFAQLVLHIGQVQISDLFCNTVGTLIGALVYLVSAKIRRMKK